MTVASGASDVQVRAVRGPNLSDSQADSAGSIPVTRSNVKAQVRDGISRLGPGRSGALRAFMPLACLT
jgi:hypothetical protein